MIFFLFILFYLIIHFLLNLLGYLFKGKSKNNFHYPIYGLSVMIIILNFSFFFLKVSLISAAYVILFLSTLNFFYIIKNKNLNNFLLSFFKSASLGFPIFIFFSIFYLIYGEKLILFRGNQWDYFHYLGQSLIVFKNDYNQLTNNLNEIYGGISVYWHDRPITYLNVALVKVLTNLDIFKTGFLYKCICISLAGNGFSKIINFKKKKKIILYSILFPFSFWVFYIYEIDAVAHLASISIALVLTGLVLDLIKEKESLIFLLKISITSAALFIIYTEIFFIFLLLFFFIFIFNKKIYILFKAKIFFLVLLLFLIFTLPGYDSTYGVIFKKIINNISGLNPDYWTYYGAFILGKESIILDEKNVALIKSIISYGFNYNSIIEIIKVNYLNGYQLFFLNIIPSFFGLFIITIGKINYSLDFYINLIIVLLVNFLIILFFLKKNYLTTENSFYKILTKPILIIFVFLSSFFFIRNSYWQIIKLYFYLSPFLYLFIIINKKSIFKYLFILTVSLTPIYQYSINNDGIGRKNSFPSIINPIYKKKFDWVINIYELDNCRSVEVKINTERYNVHKYNYASLKVYDNENVLKENYNNIYKCFITENGSKFIIVKE
jgi:hypothetical protein